MKISQLQKVILQTSFFNALIEGDIKTIHSIMLINKKYNEYFLNWMPFKKCQKEEIIFWDFFGNKMRKQILKLFLFTFYKNNDLYFLKHAVSDDYYMNYYFERILREFQEDFSNEYFPHKLRISKQTLPLISFKDCLEMIPKKYYPCLKYVIYQLNNVSLLDEIIDETLEKMPNIYFLRFECPNYESDLEMEDKIMEIEKYDVSFYNNEEEDKMKPLPLIFFKGEKKRVNWETLRTIFPNLHTIYFNGEKWSWNDFFKYFY